MSLKGFYSGKVVLLTGATGFIGRLLLAKLLRLGNVKEILMISRAKRGKTNEERLNAILSGVLFEEMENFDPKFRSKLRIINGDMEVEDLGISFSDREYIKNNAEIIIHGAATVRFDEQLRKAIAINVRGTKNMLDIAMEVKNLQSFVHISTAYSQCPRSEISETFYATPMDYRRVLMILENFKDDVADAISQKLIAPWPNTYTFTKAVTEDMIRQRVGTLPLSIIRPTIVQSTLCDPYPGFADKIIGPIGLAVGIMAGMIRVVKTSKEVAVDVIPADIVVNSILAIACQTAKRLENQNNIYISSICNIRDTTITFCLEAIVKFSEKFPTKKMIWLPRFTGTSSDFMYRFYFVLYHYIPALFYDIVLKIQGSKTRLFGIYSQVFYQTQLLDYFMQKSWKFDDSNMFELYRNMSEKDHQDFPVTLKPEDYEKHCTRGCNGLRKYFFKENDADLLIARKRYKLFNVLHNLLLVLVYGSLAYSVYLLFN